MEFCTWLANEKKVAAVPLHVFYAPRYANTKRDAKASEAKALCPKPMHLLLGRFFCFFGMGCCASSDAAASFLFFSLHLVDSCPGFRGVGPCRCRERCRGRVLAWPWPWSEHVLCMC